MPDKFTPAYYNDSATFEHLRAKWLQPATVAATCPQPLGAGGGTVVVATGHHHHLLLLLLLLLLLMPLAAAGRVVVTTLQ